MPLRLVPALGRGDELSGRAAAGYHCSCFSDRGVPSRFDHQIAVGVPSRSHARAA